MPTTFHFIDSRRSMLAKGLISTVPPWPDGSEQRVSYLLLWSTRSGGTSSKQRRSTPTISRFRYSLLATSRPRPAGYGHMCATIGRQAIPLHRPYGLLTRRIARESIHHSI